MKSRIMYVELKSGYSDDGPAWIGRAFFSKTGRSLYFNGLAFGKESRGGGNYYEVLNGDYYWISGIKKSGTNRHWAGHGKIKIDKNVVDEYLKIREWPSLPGNRYEVVELDNNPPIEEFHSIENIKMS